MTLTRILVVDDEAKLRTLLSTGLTGHGYEVATAADGVEAIEKVAHWSPHLVVLDLGLPLMDGVDVCRVIRAWSHVPIIVLSVRDDEHDMIATLDLGADDYLTKPFRMGELLARIRVALRHSANHMMSESPIVAFDGLRIDLARRQIYVDDQEVRLTRKEYDLLTTLAQSPGRVLTYTHLLRAVWGNDESEQDIRTLRVFMGQVRRKINDDPTNPRFIFTESGVGYRFRVAPE